MGRLRDAELDPVRDVDRLLYRTPQQMLPAPPQAEAAAIVPAPQAQRLPTAANLPTTSPQPVVFELPRPPDDPGPDAGEPKRKEGRVW
jgi:hypothetical protein